MQGSVLWTNMCLNLLKNELQHSRHFCDSVVNKWHCILQFSHDNIDYGDDSNNQQDNDDDNGNDNDDDEDDDGETYQ